MAETPTVWLADWSDEEDAAFRRAWGARAPAVLRAAAARHQRGQPVAPGAQLARLRRPGRAGPARGRPRRRGGGLAAARRRAARPARAGRGPRASSCSTRCSRRATARRRRACCSPACAARTGSSSTPRRRRRRPWRSGWTPGGSSSCAGGGAAAGVPPPDRSGPLLAAGRDHRDWAAWPRPRAGRTARCWSPARTRCRRRCASCGPDGRAAFRRWSPRPGRWSCRCWTTARQAGTLAVLDAVAAGRPVVATAVRARRSTCCPARVAWLPAGDVAALADALRAAGDPGAARAVGPRRGRGARPPVPRRVHGAGGGGRRGRQRAVTWCTARSDPTPRSLRRVTRFGASARRTADDAS